MGINQTEARKMKVIVYQILYNGVDGLAKTEVIYSSLSEKERDEVFSNYGENKCYYRKYETILDLKQAGKALVAKLDGNDKMIIDLCLCSDLSILFCTIGDQNVVLYEKK